MATTTNAQQNTEDKIISHEEAIRVADLMLTQGRTEEGTALLIYINGTDGNVSVTEMDKIAKKARAKPVITFSVNIDANYARLETLAAASTDDEGNAQSVHAFIKYHVFHTLEGLTWTGEVQRKVGSAPKVEDSLLARAMGADKVKAMTAGDRAKKERQLVKGLSDQLESNPDLMAAVMAAMAKLAESADKQESIEQAAILAK